MIDPLVTSVIRRYQMNTMRSFSAKKWVVVGCSLFLLLAEFSQAQPSTQSPSFLYSVGTYGDLRKMDTALNVVATAKVPGLARAVGIAAADISPDGKRLFLAVSSGGNPLVVIQTADLSIDRDMKVVFPPLPEHWIQHAPFDIIAVSSEMLYWSDECYTSDPTGAYSTLLVNLKEKVAKPIREWSFENRNELKISPDRERMAVYYGGRLYVIRSSTGQVLAKVEQETIGQRRSIWWFDMDWSRDVLQCYTAPWTVGEAPTEKLRIDMNSHEVVAREALKVSPEFDLAALQRNGRRSISSKTYILDESGSLQIFDHAKGQLSKRFNSVVPKPAENARLVPQVSPGGDVIVVPRNRVEKLADGRNYREVSTLYAIDPQTGRVTKTLEYPDHIVTVLFGE
jgi:hypothetical protein